MRVKKEYCYEICLFLLYKYDVVRFVLGAMTLGESIHQLWEFLRNDIFDSYFFITVVFLGQL